MSILIKGMDMPQNCCECKLILWDGGTYICPFSSIMALSIGIQDDCPLVDVPTPHGRLIDADELHEKMYHESFEVDSDMQKWESGCWIRYKVFENCENQTPTIIEAEE